jgi:hypothetical protein
MRHTGVIALLLAGAIPASAEVTILESDARRVIMEIVPAAADVRTAAAAGGAHVTISIPGFGQLDEPGQPELPVQGVRVALPPRTAPRLAILAADWTEWRTGAVRPVPERLGVRDPFGPSRVEEAEPVEGPAYRSAAPWPAEPFALGGEASVRHLATVSVVVHGAQADPLRGSYRLLRRAVLEVRFETDPSRADAALRPAPLDARWQRAYRSAVANGEDASSFARGGPGDAPSVGDAPFGAGDQWKLVIRETGLVDVPFATLAAEGFPAGIPVDHLVLYQRGFRLDEVDDAGTPAADLFTTSDVPCEIVDDGDGVFGGGDAIRLWGRSFRDQWMTSGWEHEDRFTQDNVVWLRIDPSGGARFESVRESGSLSGAPGDSLPSTPSTWFHEWDRKFYRRPPDFGFGRRAFESEFFFWNDSRDATGGTTGWKLKGESGGPETFQVVDLVPGSAGSLRVRVLGGGRPVDSNYTNRFEVNVNGQDPPLGERQFTNTLLYVGENVPPDSVLTTFPVPPGVLVEGTNEFQFTGWTYRGFGTSSIFFSTRFFFDWYEVTWQRRLVARDGRVRLTTVNGGAGNQIVRAEGFAGPDLALYDVTDPALPRRVGLALDGSQVVDVGGTFDLRFDHDNVAGPGEYVVVQTSAVPELPAERVARRPATGVLAGGVGAQYVVATHAEFLSGAGEIAAHRRGKYSAHVAELEEVWDVFGNGQRSPRALKGFTAYAFHRWATPIEHLLLVGDGSEDTRGVTATSMPDFVPSHGLWASYEGAYDVSDQYYCEVTRGNPADPDGFDDLADFHVGRLPVSDAEELDWNIQRIRAYEAGGRELWRRRVLLHADDAFSGSLGGGVGTPYGFRSIENLFRENSEAYAEFLVTDHADQIVPVEVFLGDWTQTCPDSCYTSNDRDCEESLGRDCGFWYDCRDFTNWVEVYTCMKANTGPAVLAATQAALERGALLWNYQGHANRYWMAHEEVFRDDEIGSDRNDVSTLTNEGRPFIFLGWACHLGEYDTAEEEDVRVDDCMSEKMLNVRQAGLTEPGGAVAAFASSGFEFLTPNVEFNRVFFEQMFPADGAGSTPTTLGEAITRSRLAYQSVYPLDGNTRQAAQRFLLFGDPALEATLGTSPIRVTANGTELRDGETIALSDLGETVEIVARTEPGSGAVALKLFDSRRGQIPADAVRVTGSDPLELVHEATARAEGVDLTVVAVDAAGRETSFSLGLRADFRLDALAVFPNPFSDRAAFYYRAAGAETATLHVYTINGRKIREITEAATGEGAVEWDGRDADGDVVANGTYLVRFAVHGASGTLERTTQVVKMR